uniref:Grass carp reovirus (GCRV)-induced gene 2p n=1 Tax=Nothobranchius furzeri TaxID=105023 RepID=A0A8C6P9X2_NOTFU
MSVEFSGWEVVDDGACFPGVILGPSQAPQNKGVYTMFHGTHVSSARAIITSGFQPSGGGTLGKGVYVSRDKNKASNYPLFGNSSDQVILEVRVRVGRVKRIDPADIQMRITWSTHGYNTAWIPPANAISGLEEDCVFDPKRVTVILPPSNKGVYTMYHGTSIANARNIITNGFKQSQTGMLGKGVYVSRDRKKAERYPLHNSSLDRVVLELHIRVGRVKRIDTDNHPMQYTWSSQGYDTAWVPPNCGMKAVPSGLEEDYFKCSGCNPVLDIMSS